MQKFKTYLLNEENSFLGHRVGDVLTSMQDLQDDMPNLGLRHLGKLVEQIVAQIRTILHSSWSPEQQSHLKDLQRIAVALMKTLDEKGDLRQMLPAAVADLQNLSGKLGVKVNNLKAPEQQGGIPVSPNDFQLTGNGPNQQNTPQGQLPAPGPGQALGGNPLQLPQM